MHQCWELMKSQQWVLDWQEEPILLRDTEASVLGFAR
jgi:hypothetical protein